MYLYNLKNNDFYFGRNLDLEYQFGEQVVITTEKLCDKITKKIRIYHPL